MEKIGLTLAFIICGLSGVFAQQKLDVEGHRGGMGLMPENTIASMLNGVKTGVRTLELDLNITSDGKVVVSHDQWMSSAIMLKPDGSEITPEEEKSLALYKMTYDSIRRFDAGTKPNVRFPKQARLKTYKPLLSDLIDSVEAYVKKNKLKPVYYNIETKSTPAGDGIYNPTPDVFVKLMMDVISSKHINKRVIIQSFDVRTLQVLHKTNPKIKLSYLVGKINVEDDLKKLGFTPNIYSPYYTFVNADIVKKVHDNKMLILPWTVDEEKDMKALADLGVDGIISNYPDKLVQLFGSYQSK
ncbi:glycerophosphodiester phosphodiesterase family protein [Mucilaginibacter sp. SG564]|uniref:glycerophosphodiester phosphodiesterase family protein n=1 Tax=Mucilaginibacter sp. SG564 TaxID=2587022 RepID=UPI00155430C6|nr:glycerophosphodiester phosphodiesterase family protein [Mucilaginibacter sp. SG564]NOW96592.1 glycerophosphoryl diester phosphodiesterase [Mucilaginibacter sp. SG564]